MRVRSRDSGDPRKVIGALRCATETIRSAVGGADMPASWIAILLSIAEAEAQPLSELKRQVGLQTSTVLRIVYALGKEDRFGKPGLNLIEEIADPRHATRKLYFLSAAGRRLMAEVVCAVTGGGGQDYPVSTGSEFAARFAVEQANRVGHADIKAFTPQQVAKGKRSLARRNISVGPYAVGFPLLLARPDIEAIKRWVEEEYGGKVYELPGVAKPDGMVIADLPDETAQFWFYIRWG